MASGNQQLNFAIRAVNEATAALKSVQGDLDGITKAADQAENKTGGFGKTLGDVGKVATGFVAAFAVTSAIDGVRGFMSGAVDAASDLGESLNAVNVVFKDNAKTVLDWGKNNAVQFGLSQREFNQMATPLGAMLKNTGMGMDDVANNTVELTKRAADMASVFNTDVGDALTAIQAALRGESDPIERYGVSLNAAKVEARALADTGKTVASTLTDQEKAAARLALLFEQTNDVAGDFQNTSDGLANSQRIQAARTEELRAEIGEKLIPVMLKWNEIKFALVQLIAEKLLPAVSSMFTMLGKGSAVVKTFADYLRFTWEEGDSLNDFLADVPEPLQGLAKFAGDAAIVLKEKLIPGAQQVATVFVEQVIPAAVRMASFVAEQVGTLVAHLGEHFKRFPAYYEEEIQPALENIMALVTTVVNWFREHWPEIMKIVQPVLDEVVVLVELAGSIITGVLDIIIKLLQGDWSGAWNATKQLFTEVWESMKETVSNAKEFIVAVLSGLRDVGVAMVGGLLEGAQSKLGELANWFFALPGRIVSEIPNPLSVLYNIGKQIIQGLIDGIKSMISGVTGAVGGAISAIPDTAKKILKIFSPSRVMMDLGKQISEGLAIGISDSARISVAPAAMNMVTSIPRGVVSGASNVGGGISGAGATIVNIYVTQPLGTPDQIARAVQGALVSLERRGGISAGTTRPVAV